MPAPAAAAPAALPVVLQVSEDLILGMLDLPEGAKLAGAQVEHWGGPRLILHLEMPGAPERATEVSPVYAHQSAAGAVRLTELRWLRNGDEIGTTAFPGH
jgi:hypothetical protein